MRNLSKIITAIIFASWLTTPAYAQSTQGQAKAYFYAAEEAYEAGDYESALQGIGKAEEISGQTGTVLLKLEAKILFKLERYQETKSVLNEFYASGPSEKSQREMAPILLAVNGKIDEKNQLDKNQRENVNQRKVDANQARFKALSKEETRQKSEVNSKGWFLGNLNPRRTLRKTHSTNANKYHKFVKSVSFSSNGKAAITGHGDDEAVIWDLTSGKTKILKGHKNSVHSAKFSSDGTRAVTADWDGSVKVWSAISGELEMTFNGHSETVTDAQFSPDGKFIISADWNGIAKVWDSVSGQTFQNFSHDGSVVRAGSFAPDGRRIVTGSDDGRARVFDIDTGQKLFELYEAGDSNSSKYVSSVMYSSNGEYILTAEWDKTAKIWDASSGKLIRILKGHEGAVKEAKFSPDGQMVVTAGSYDDTARVWNTQTGQSHAVLIGHTDNVETVSFSPDGYHVLTGSNDGTAKVWRVKK